MLHVQHDVRAKRLFVASSCAGRKAGQGGATDAEVEQGVRSALAANSKAHWPSARVRTPDIAENSAQSSSNLLAQACGEEEAHLPASARQGSKTRSTSERSVVAAWRRLLCRCGNLSMLCWRKTFSSLLPNFAVDYALAHEAPVICARTNCGALARSVVNTRCSPFESWIMPAGADVRLSKSMSRILRHHPPASMDASGWVALQDLQAALGGNVTVERIRDVTANDVKGRFEVGDVVQSRSRATCGAEQHTACERC